MSRCAADDERRGPNEHGVATVLASVLVLGLIVTLWFGMQLGAATIIRHRAEGAADLAALAAAAHVPRGHSSACAQARRVVQGMSGAVESCRIDGVESRVRVRMPLPAIGTTLSTADGVRGRARAGPAGG